MDKLGAEQVAVFLRRLERLTAVLKWVDFNCPGIELNNAGSLELVKRSLFFPKFEVEVFEPGQRIRHQHPSDPVSPVEEWVIMAKLQWVISAPPFIAKRTGC